MSLRAFLAPLALSAALFAQNHVCTVTAAGESCGPQLTVTLIPNGQGGNNDLTLVATGLHARAAGGMVWGMHPMNSPILPGSACVVLTDYVWGHYFQTDTTGSYTFSRSWPWWFNGYFYMQMGSVLVSADGSGFDVKTTNCKLAQCMPE
jgi:hypothetical protein